jgi:hypothetical protein
MEFAAGREVQRAIVTDVENCGCRHERIYIWRERERERERNTVPNEDKETEQR